LADRIARKLDEREAQIEKNAARAAEVAAIEKNPVVVVKSTWGKGGFDTIAKRNVTFRNRSDKPVGNLTYRTHYFSETGNQVDQGGVDGLLGDTKKIQRVIAPKATRTIEVNDGFVHTEAYRANFELVGWEYVTDAR
jgi:hypothetical protein